jgi:hypothetical protein
VLHRRRDLEQGIFFVAFPEKIAAWRRDGSVFRLHCDGGLH